MRKKSLFVLLSAGLTASAAVAQQSEGISRGYLVKPKFGMEQKYEEAYKQHLQWHKQNNDDWSWNTYQYETGERFGQYVIISGGHNWTDFDAKDDFDKKDAADFMAKAGPYVEEAASWFSRTLYNLSRLPGDGDGPISFVSVEEFQLNPGKSGDFLYVVKKVNEAIKKTNRPVHYVIIQELSGSEAEAFTVVVLKKDWADFKPLEKSLEDVTKEVYGEVESDAMWETFFQAVRSTTNTILRYRPDLSYQPPTATN